MSNRYAVVLEPGAHLPERDALVSQAWGSVPVSYFQDREVFSDCSFLDLKVNKWEVNREWSSKQSSEPWIRIEKFKGQSLDEFLRKEGAVLPVDMAGITLMIIEMDEGGIALDYCLLLRLVSGFLDQFKVYRWSGSLEEVFQNTIVSLPDRHGILEQLIKCE